MKHRIVICLAVMLFAVVAVTGLYAAMTHSASEVVRLSSEIDNQTPDNNPLYLMLNEIEDMLEGTTAIDGLQLTSPTVTTPTVTSPTITGNATVSGTLLNKVVVEVVTGADTLTASQSGSYLFYTDADTVTLPKATGSGAIFFIVDANAAAAADLTVDPNDADSINGATAGNYIQCTTDADGTMATLIDADPNEWYAIYSQAAWTEE